MKIFVEESPVEIVETILEDSYLDKVSDIHIEPFEKVIKIRQRIDGVLREYAEVDISLKSSIITRIKILGEIDISEKRFPQDGRFEYFVYGSGIDIRISTFPTVFGEKIVLRLLDKSKFSLKREDLGLRKEDNIMIDRFLSNKGGIVLISGGTGSGKTTTLYSFLKNINSVEKNITTIEDPVEYRLDGINQMQVKTSIGLDFSKGLRSILRQDPDTIMIGEIRDRETAEIAIRAAITGHLVLSTIHTKDTLSTIVRLIDMGIEPYLISSSVIGIIAQRLVKKLCLDCKEELEIDDLEKKFLKVESGVIYKKKGCENCNYSGYKGRIGIFEILEIDKDLRQYINIRKSEDYIRNILKEKGQEFLFDKGISLVKEGLTSLEEMMSVCNVGDEL